MKEYNVNNHIICQVMKKGVNGVMELIRIWGYQYFSEVMV